MLYEVTLEDYIRLASDSYFPDVDKLFPEIKLKDKRNTPVNGFYQESILQKKHGWVRALESKPDPTGFSAVFYKRVNELGRKDIGTGVIAFRGSDDIYDFIHHDLRLAHGNWPLAFQNALEFYKEVIKDGKIKNLSFCGHSLGGALAQLVAIHANKFDYAANKCPAICFNAPQVGKIIKDYPNGNFQRHVIDDYVNKIRNNIAKVAHNNEECVKKTKEFEKYSTLRTFFPMSYYSGLHGHKLQCKTEPYIDWLPKIKAWVNDLTPFFKDVYTKMGYIKNMKDCVAYGQPAFNCIYHLITKVPYSKDLNRNDFKVTYNELVESSTYDYIFNFNAFYDLVHACGYPIGSQCTIDIDKRINLDKKVRMQAELRTFLTLQPEYFQHRSEIIKLDNCKIDIQNKVLKKLDVSKIGYTKIAKEAAIYYLGDRWDEEAVYYTYTQHSMDNLSTALLKEEGLLKTTFKKSNLAKDIIKKFNINNPLEQFGDEFHHKIADMIVAAGLDYMSCRKVV